MTFPAPHCFIFTHWDHTSYKLLLLLDELFQCFGTSELFLKLIIRRASVFNFYYQLICWFLTWLIFHKMLVNSKNQLKLKVVWCVPKSKEMYSLQAENAHSQTHTRLKFLMDCWITPQASVDLLIISLIYTKPNLNFEKHFYKEHFLPV